MFLYVIMYLRFYRRIGIRTRQKSDALEIIFVDFSFPDFKSLLQIV